MKAESPIVVVAAIAANLVIAAAKFGAAFLTGNPAMLAEGIHSAVDTGNEVLLFVGIQRSLRPADARHPFGYGHEVYFWSLVVAVVLFGIGGGMSMLEGIQRFFAPLALRDPLWDYVVLAFAALIEGVSWTISYRALRRAFPDRSVVAAIVASKDPTVFTVLLEDTAALAGIAIAAVGTVLAHRSGDDRYEAAASIAIGLLLLAAASILIAETRGLLIGESVEPRTVERIRAIVLGDPDVVGVGGILTMYLGPEDVLLNIELQFRPGISGDELAAATARIGHDVKTEFARIRRVFIEAQPGTPDARSPLHR